MRRCTAHLALGKCGGRGLKGAWLSLGVMITTEYRVALMPLLIGALSVLRIVLSGIFVITCRRTAGRG